MIAHSRPIRGRRVDALPRRESTGRWRPTMVCRNAVTDGRRNSPRRCRPASISTAKRLRRARGHAVGVEHSVNVAQAVDGLIERARIADLDYKAVLDHWMADGAARLKDVDAGLCERPRHVLEQT